MDGTQIALLIVSTILLGLLIWLAVRLIISKTKAHDKRIMVFVVAALGVWLIPLIGGYIGGALVAIGNVFSFIPETTNHMGTLTVIIIFLLFLIIIKYLLDTPWDKAVWITLFSLFLLYLLFSIVPYIGYYMETPI